MHWGFGHMGRHPNTWGGVQTEGGPTYPHITCRNPLEHIDAQGSWGHMGYLNIWGALGGL